MDKIVLVTSIVPRGIINQKNAIASWINNGFRVISCNSKDEITMLQDDFPQVEFVEVYRDARKIMGKPCPYIFDMLQILKERSLSIGGIINSDIHLRNFSEAMYDYLYEESKNKVIFMRRHDIDDLQDVLSLHSTMYLGGIDVFLFHKDVIDSIPDDEMILGQVMWDYWMPIILEKSGIEVKEFINPVAFHVRHLVQWKAEATDIIAKRLCRKYFPHISEENATSYLKNKFLELMSDRDLQICYITRKMKESEVGIETDDPNCEIYDQTHRKITVLSQDQHIFSNCKYFFKIPYHIIPSKVMIDLAIWILEQYEWDSLQLGVYWRGNLSNSLRIENCNQQMLKKFNMDIPPIIVSKYIDNVEINNGVMGICNIYTCSVYVEEDAKKIWSAHDLYGKIYIYPVGYVAQMWIRRFAKEIRTIEVLGFVDRSVEMQKKSVCGYRVYSPDVLDDIQSYDKVVIISNMYTDEIYQSLIKRMPKDKILIWNEFDGRKWLKDREEIWSEVSC